MPSIEDIILNQGKWTGISGVRLHLSHTFVEDAARFMVLDNPGHAFILTGFFIPLGWDSPTAPGPVNKSSLNNTVSVPKSPIPETGSVESDGPPGAYFLGKALTKLGWKITYVVDHYAAFTLKGQPTVEEVIEFPITDEKNSEDFAKELLAKHDPSVLVAVERPGMSAEGKYQFVGGTDVTVRTAKLDYLFRHHNATVGIGDWGNEIGLANISEFTGPNLPSKAPTITGSTHPIIAAVSNWGAYGLIAAISKITNRNLLPHPDMEFDHIQRLIECGMVDGRGRSEWIVDGFGPEENRRVLVDLWDHLYAAGITKL